MRVLSSCSSLPFATLVLALSAAASTAGCANPFGLPGADGGAASSDGGSASDGASAPTMTGSGCTGDLGAGIKLCTSVSACPGLAVDHDVFPNCGFRVHGDSLDLECVCQGVLCPMGVPSTCAQAAQMLSSQNESIVCTQVGEDRCTSIGAGTGGTSTCNKDCASRCAGEPTCIRECGC
jgi:hypothetical protein